MAKRKAKDLADLTATQLYRLAKLKEAREAKREARAVKKQVTALKRAKASMLKKVAKIDARIAALTGKGKRKARGKRVRVTDEQILKVVAKAGKKGITVPLVVGAFGCSRSTIQQRLPKMKAIKKISRGIYAVK